MTVTVGTASFYHTRLPHQSKLEKIARNMDLSREARVRLTWLTHYKKQGNASVTARRFGISRSTLHKWVKRYAERGLRGLEDLSRAPHNRRGPRPSPGRRSTSSALSGPINRPGASTRSP